MFTVIKLFMITDMWKIKPNCSLKLKKPQYNIYTALSLALPCLSMLSENAYGICGFVEKAGETTELMGNRKQNQKSEEIQLSN